VKAVDALPKSPLGVRVVAGGVCVAFGALLIQATLAIPEGETGLAPLVAERLPESGVTNAVTACLLNFRGYDTLLEIAVLVLAAVGVMAVGGSHASAWKPLARQADPILSALTRLLAPVMVLVAGYLLWAGEHAPGGAFQAGSLIGAAGVLLTLSGYGRPAWVSHLALRAVIAVGFIVFVAIALGGMMVGGAFLEYPREHAKTLMLLLETWLTVSIGAILVSLFFASATPIDERTELMETDRG